MPKNILITGVSGTGKSTIAEALRQGGHHAVDMDAEFCTMYYKDSKKPVDTDFQNHDLAWVQSVEWICDRAKLRALLSQHGTIFCCGSADNILDILPEFDAVALLQTDDETFRRRLTDRTNNDWGRTADVQKWLLKQKYTYEKVILDHGAIPIDAHREINDVVADVLKIAES